jgi:hypothetical protein
MYKDTETMFNYQTNIPENNLFRDKSRSLRVKNSRSANLSPKNLSRSLNARNESLEE